MNKYLSIVLGCLLSNSVQSAEYWTVKADGGIMAKNDGVVVINIKNYQPIGPNPADSVWGPCKGNWIYLHKTANGTINDEKHVDRMLSVALSAYKTNSRIRVRIERDSSNKCFSDQIYDQGV